jgi:hypothetical protein
MKTPLRLALAACLGLAALALAGSAMAAYQPRIIVKNPIERLGAASSLVLRVEQPRDDDATFRLVLNIPLGYTATLVPATDGQTIGSVTAQAQANAISPEAVLELTGTIRADTTFTAAEYPVAAGCLSGTGITAPDVVYRLELSAAGQTLIVPMYVEPVTTPPLSTAFAAQIVTCLPSPYIPQAQGGAAFGAKLINADLTFTGLFTNPATAGDYRWSSVWTPYTVGTATVNPAGTVEAQSVDRLAAQLTVAARTRGRTVTLSGALLEGGRGVPSARVQLQLGRRAGALRTAATVTTRANGAFSAVFRNRAPGAWFVRARVTVPDRATPCVAVFAPAPCIAANVPGFANFTSRVVRFRIR